MPGQYRITNPTLALFEGDGHHVAHTVPTGAIVSIDKAMIDGEKLINVSWDGKIVMMFAQDLRVRSERVKGKAKAAANSPALE